MKILTDLDLSTTLIVSEFLFVAICLVFVYLYQHFKH